MNELALERHRLRRARSPRTVPPIISAIVPVRNEAAFLGATLHQLLEQRYDPARYEILVADGRSTDETRAVVTALQARYGQLRLLDNPRRWSSAGRNVAIRASRGDILLLIDGHCELNNPNYLQSVADAFAESDADCVARPQPLDATNASSLQRAIAAARASRLGHHPASYIYSDRPGFIPPQSAAIAYRRGVFETVGLFDEHFDACEDVEFNHRVARAGMTCWFAPEARVHYRARASLSGLFKQMVRYGRGRVRLLRKHPDTFSLPGFVPAVFLAGVVVGPLFAWWSAAAALLYVGVLGVYVAVVLLASLALCIHERDGKVLPWLPLVFPTIHAGAAIGVWSEMLLGCQRLPEEDIVPSVQSKRRAA